MKLLKIVTSTAIVCILSTTFWVEAFAQTNDQASAPMDPLMMQNMMQMRQQQMQRGQGSGNNYNMMDPVMMQNMMRHRQQMYQGQGRGMPMMDGVNNPLMMDPLMRQNMMQKHQLKMAQDQMTGMGKLGNHQGGGMMKPQMMQMKRDHMNKMEQRLGRIESLLSELVELQRKNK